MTKSVRPVLSGLEQRAGTTELQRWIIPQPRNEVDGSTKEAESVLDRSCEKALRSAVHRIKNAAGNPQGPRLEICARDRAARSGASMPQANGARSERCSPSQINSEIRHRARDPDPRFAST